MLTNVASRPCERASWLNEITRRYGGAAFVAQGPEVDCWRSRYNRAGFHSTQRLFVHDRTGGMVAINRSRSSNYNAYVSIGKWQSDHAVILVLPLLHEGLCYPILYEILDGRNLTTPKDHLGDLSDDDLYENLQKLRQTWWKRLSKTYDFEEANTYHPFPEISDIKIHDFFGQEEGIIRQWLYLYKYMLSFEIRDNEELSDSQFHVFNTTFNPPPDNIGTGSNSLQTFDCNRYVFEVKSNKSALGSYSAVLIGNKGVCYSSCEAAINSCDKNDSIELFPITKNAKGIKGTVRGRVDATSVVEIETPHRARGLPLARFNPEPGTILTVVGAYDGGPYVSECMVVRYGSYRGGPQFMVLSGSIAESAVGGALLDKDGFLRGIVLAERYALNTHEGEPIPERTPGVFFAVGVEKISSEKARGVSLWNTRAPAMKFLKNFWRAVWPKLRLLSIIGALVAIVIAAIPKLLPPARLYIAKAVETVQTEWNKVLPHRNRICGAERWLYVEDGKVRSGPSTDETELGTLTNRRISASCVVINERSEPWFEIEYDGSTGYIRADVISILRN